MQLRILPAVCLLFLAACATQPVAPPPPPPPPPPSADEAAAARDAARAAAAHAAARDATARDAAARNAAAAAEAEAARAASARRAAAPPRAARAPRARPPMDPDGNYARMRVFYATDRAPAEDFHGVDQSEKYTGKRGAMAYGQAFVSIPRGHVAGELEAPSILRLEFREDPSRHVVLLETVPQRKDAFLQSIRNRVGSSAGKNAFIFVHGYNVAFADAARRTAQLAYDLSFDGAPIFYSWPSQASLSGYTVDESNIEWSTPHIKQFIIDAAEQSGADNLFLVGHSMGTRGLTRALATLVLERPDLKGRFREIILAAPDIDADVFRDQLAPALAQAGERVTLYASSKDLALKASKEVHGYARAGDSGQGIVIIEGIDTIDASGVDDSILAHSYFVESIPVIRDIAQMLRQKLPPKSRSTLRPVGTGDDLHWLLEGD